MTVVHLGETFSLIYKPFKLMRFHKLCFDAAKAKFKSYMAGRRDFGKKERPGWNSLVVKRHRPFSGRVETVRPRSLRALCKSSMFAAVRALEYAYSSAKHGGRTKSIPHCASSVHLYFMAGEFSNQHR